MRGSVDYQINRIFMESGIFRPGESRHAEKEEARRELAAMEQQADSTRLAERTGIHSYQYARDCKDTWHRFARFARSSLYLRDMSKLDGWHAEVYLRSRIRDGISYACWKKEAAQVGKLDNALYDWKARTEGKAQPSGIRMAALDPELRSLARETLAASAKSFGHFANPELVMACLNKAGNIFAITAGIQYEGGARCREACRVTSEQLLGISVDSLTKDRTGEVLLDDTKGGKVRIIRIGVPLYERLEAEIDRSGGCLQVPMGGYSKAVRRAAEMAGEALRGTHAFRYCYARNRYRALTAYGGPGLSHEAAIQQISREMGHERADITHLYLR